MPRIYSRYTEKDYKEALELAKKLGLTPSAFQHYCVLLYANQQGGVSEFNKLSANMINNLEALEEGAIFTVAALLPDDWASISQSDKVLLAKQVVHHIDTHPETYQPYPVKLKRRAQYIKLKKD